MSTTYGEQRTEQEKAIDADVLARVQRGLAWLEETHGPGWEEKIDLATFSIGDSQSCVLGQVYAVDANGVGLGWDGYDYATEKLLSAGECADHGFDMTGEETERTGWGPLQAAWEFVLRPRVTAT